MLINYKDVLEETNFYVESSVERNWKVVFILLKIFQFLEDEKYFLKSIKSISSKPSKKKVLIFNLVNKCICK